MHRPPGNRQHWLHAIGGGALLVGLVACGGDSNDSYNQGYLDGIHQGSIQGINGVARAELNKAIEDGWVCDDIDRYDSIEQLTISCHSGDDS